MFLIGIIRVEGVTNMIFQYIRKNSGFVEDSQGAKRFRTWGPKVGLVLATERNKVGWSLWNEKAETEEFRSKYRKRWEQSGMAESVINRKVKKIHAIFNLPLAIRIAKERSEQYVLDPIPNAYKDHIENMVKRSQLYFKK